MTTPADNPFENVVTSNVLPDDFPNVDTNDNVNKGTAYVIEPGDTIQSIAEARNVKWEDIHSKNAEIIGTNINILPIGETIYI